MWKKFLARVAVLALPVYPVAVIIWRFALAQSWLDSLVGLPLALFVMAIIQCAVMSSRAYRYNVALLGLTSSVAMIALSVSVIIYALVSPGHFGLLLLFLIVGVLAAGALVLFTVRIRRERAAR